MSRGPQIFRQSDVVKAIKALLRAGGQGHVDIMRDGNIRVTVTDKREKQPADEWD